MMNNEQKPQLTIPRVIRSFFCSINIHSYINNYYGHKKCICGKSKQLTIKMRDGSSYWSNCV
jgi:hypothetical protein